MSKMPIYLDYAAATPLDQMVQKAMQPYFRAAFFNPSANYASAKQVRMALESARTKLAYNLGAKSSEIIFTAGGTEANNLAIHGIMSHFPEANIVVSSLEHESVLMPARQYDHKEVRVLSDGRLDLADLEKKIDENTVLVSVMQANNEIGTIEPIREISQIISRLRKSRNKLPLYFHTDAAQAANYLDLHVSSLGVDLMTVNGGKIYGPKQIGALYVKAGILLEPQILGGGQERGLRSGTENVAGAIGLATALEIAQNIRQEESIRLKKLQQNFIELLKAELPSAIVNGSLKHRLPNNIHFSLPGHDNERMLIELDEAGIMAAAGSACSASSEEPSHVLRAVGLSTELAQASLRFTMGRQTTDAMINYTILQLKKLA
jgi:cysteine desulfurase